METATKVKNKVRIGDGKWIVPKGSEVVSTYSKVVWKDMEWIPSHRQCVKSAVGVLYRIPATVLEENEQS